MKKLSLALAFLSMGLLSYAQQKADAVHATSVPVTYHGITGRLDQFVDSAGTINEITKTEKIGYHPKGDWIGNQFTNANALPNGDDPVWQQDYAPPAPPTKALGVGWNGMGYTGVNPADPSVDVGPNHVVQMINGGSGAYIQVYSKTGVPQGGQVYFDNFMSLPGGAGDPIVLYDERADRWFLSEFSQTGNNLHIAISTTADPGGTYHTYSFNSPGGFPDYPKYSIWENEYVMTANVNTPDIFAFNRADMLAGVATTAQQFSQSNFGTIGFQASTPVSLNGTVTPPTGQPALLMRMRDDAWTGSASDALEMWELDIDWVTPANSTLSQVQTLGTAPLDSDLCGYTSFQCFPQPGTTTTLDPLRELLMNRVHYRNFGTHESIVCCHVTDVDNTDRGGVRWYELRRTGGTAGTWSIYQQGTYSPDATNRWMASISISASGNIGLAYSAASGTVFPSLRYTGRKECDPLGTMTEPETVLVAGTASNASNRWGDYFQLNCDPSDGETFWHTGCFNTSTQWSTRVSSFDIATCSPQVSFVANTYSENESNGTTTNPSSACLPYVDIIVPISIGSAPSQNADIVVSATGGTATLGVDFDLLNGTTTLNSSNLSSNITIRVYNDALVEGNETIILTYTLNANSGDAVAGTINQSVTITINDDDLTPAGSTITTTVLSENFEAGFGGFSTVNNGTATATPWQVGNNAAAASGAYAIPTTNATNFAWINDDACNCDQNDVDLVFPAVDLTNYTSAALSFDSYFEDNTYQTNNENADLYVSVNGAPDVLVGALVASTIDLDWTTQNYDLTPYVGNANVIFKVKYSDATGWLYGCTVDDVLITGTGSIGIQTAINTGTGMTADLGPNETVHFYDPTSGDVMLSLNNTSAFDYGCVTVEVDRQGTTPTAVQFNTTNTADYLHSKTFTIVPTNTNPAGSYDVTLYYEEAEVAAWEAATGNSRNNAEIVKVDGANQISNVTPATAGSFTISSSAATLGAFGTDVTFTSSFSTGFSGFGVGIYNAVTGTPPVANFSATPTTICANETVTFTDLSTNTPTSWSWNFGDAGTSTLQNPTHVYTTAGTYTVTLIATNADGSDTQIQTNLITVNAIPTVAATGTATICAGQSAAISATGATTYSWDNGAGTNATATVSPTATTTYTVTGTTSGCSATSQVTVTVNPLPTVVATGAATICAGQSTTISATGATTYSWDNGAGTNATATVSPTATTTYTVTGTTNGCSATSQVTVTVEANPVIAVGTVSNPTTCAASTGSIQVTGTGTGDIGWSGAVTGSMVGVTLPYTITGLPAGTYSIGFSSATGCNSNVITQTLVDPSAPNVVASGTTTICAGQSAAISATGATTYSWDNGAGTNATATVSPTTTTTYTVTGTTSGCSATSQVTVTVNPLPTVAATGTATICAGQSATISATGATTYSWDNGAGTNATATVSPTTTTTYTVTGTTSGCSATSQVTVTVNPLPTVVASGAVTLCEGQTTIISATGATTYSWDNGAGTNASAAVSPTTTTTYTVTGTTNGCSATDQVTVTVEANPVIAVGTVNNPTTCAASTGSIQVTGTGTGDIGWSGATSGSATGITLPYTITGLPAGSYTVGFSSSTGCNSNVITQTLVDPSAPNVVASGTTTICAGQSAAISATGATTYSWDNGAGTNATATVSPTTTTTYTVTGTTSGCSATSQVTVTVNPLPTVAATGTATICAGQSATISATGATTYSWDNGAGTNATATVSPTTTTTYTVTGTTNGCSATSQVTVTVNPLPTVAATGAATICAGQSATITGSGATTYSWDNGAGTNAAATVSPASTTTYTVTGTTNGCSATDQVTITVNALPTVVTSGTATICAGQSTTIAAIGANTYVWDDPTGSTNATLIVTPTVTTTYTVTGTTNGCSATSQVTVTVNPLPTVVASGAGTICAGQSATITGSGATTYSWDNGAGSNATATVSPTSTTTYTVTGTTSGCSATDQVTVTVNALPNVVATGSATICSGTSTPISATGATSYAWDNGAGTNASATVSPTATTTYTVTGTTNGCTNTDQVTVTVNQTPVIASGTVTNPNVCATSTGSIQITGSATGDISWTGTASGNANGVTLPYTVTGLAAGTYTVSFVSAAGCASNSISQSLSDPTPPTTPTISPSGATTFCDGGSVTLTSSYGSGNTWSDNSTASTLVVTTSGTYGVVYTDGNGCSAASTPLTITVNPNPTVIATGTTSICEGGSAPLNASGATTYSWDNGAGANASTTVSPTVTTTYTVTGTTDGCTGTDQVTVTVNAATSSTQNVEICEGSDYTVLGSTYNTTGTYTDVTTNAAGCDSTVTTNLTVNPNPTVAIIPATIDTLCITSDPITLIGTPGGGTFSGTGVTGSVFDPSIGIGTYTITYDYTDANGCSGQSTVIAIVAQCPNSVAELGLVGVSLFPNPNEGIFMISGLAIGTEYEIYDDKGRLVSIGAMESEEQEIRLLDVQTGIYYLYATQNGQKGSLKFLITK